MHTNIGLYICTALHYILQVNLVHWQRITGSLYVSSLTNCLFLVSGESLKYGLHGNMLHLNPQIPAQPDRILWTYNGNKMVEFDGSQQEAFIQFKNRVTLDWITAELNITGLRYDDSGDYVLEAIIQKNIQLYRFKVLVIGKCCFNFYQLTRLYSMDHLFSKDCHYFIALSSSVEPKCTVTHCRL